MQSLNDYVSTPHYPSINRELKERKRHIGHALGQLQMSLDRAGDKLRDTRMNFLTAVSQKTSISQISEKDIMNMTFDSASQLRISGKQPFGSMQNGNDYFKRYIQPENQKRLQQSERYKKMRYIPQALN